MKSKQEYDEICNSAIENLEKEIGRKATWEEATAYKLGFMCGVVLGSEDAIESITGAKQGHSMDMILPLDVAP